MAAAFRDFDFEGNPKWQQYKSSLEIPAGKDVESVVNRLKAKWYRREIDPSFEVSAAANGTSPQQPKAGPGPTHPEGGVQQNGTASSPPAQSTQPTAPPQNGASGGAAGDVKRPEAAAAAPANSRGGFLKKLLSVLASSHKDRLFFLHAILVLSFILHLQPIARQLSQRSWAYFMQTALIVHGYKVFLKYGAPQLRPFSVAAIKQWTVQASASTDFQYALLALVFLPSKPVLLVMVPMTTLAVYHLFSHVSQRYASTNLWKKYGSNAHQWLLHRQQQALLYNAAAEVGAGFVVILSLLSPPRSFFLVFIYWQFLRMRFWSPDAASYHRMAWGQLDQRFGRYLNYVPMVKVPIGYLQRWFQQAPTR